MAAKFSCALIVVLLLLMPLTAIDNSPKNLDEPIVVNNATMDSYNHSVYEQEVITLQSEKEVPSLPIEESVKATPETSLVATQVDDNGYEWITHDGKSWYRTAESQSEWIEFQN